MNDKTKLKFMVISVSKGANEHRSLMYLKCFILNLRRDIDVYIIVLNYSIISGT